MITVQQLQDQYGSYLSEAQIESRIKKSAKDGYYSVKIAGNGFPTSMRETLEAAGYTVTYNHDCDYFRVSWKFDK